MPRFSAPSKSSSSRYNPDLSKSDSFSAPSKSSESSGSGLGFTAERELGSAGGISATARATVNVDNLISKQGVQIETDATNKTVGFDAGIGSTRGKLGVNIGGKVKVNDDGSVDVKEASAGINIGGFGAKAGLDDEGGGKFGISIAGISIGVGVDREGKKSLSLGYSVPGGSVEVTFSPDGEKKEKKREVSNNFNNINEPVVFPVGSDNYCRVVLNLQQYTRRGFVGYGGWSELELTTTVKADFSKQYRTYTESTKVTQWNFNPTTGQRTSIQYTIDYADRPAQFSGRFFRPQGYQIEIANAYYEGRGEYAWAIEGKESEIYAYITNVMNKPWNLQTGGFNFWSDTQIGINKFTISDGICYLPNNKTAPPLAVDNNLIVDVPTNLPNYPQKYKPMDCCDKIEEIYKYLGIAKLKKNKFPVSNAFLVPGGSGNDSCIDYYAIVQALFRMLANGLIINPKSKPLGSEWQNANATAWAASMYEMMAETMSDGNSTQRFEIAAMMQLTQMMATVAENGRKIEFVADAIGFEPLLVPEEVPVCFTIHESHKGFGKKESKKIKVSGLKTDEQVENTLGKMLLPSLIPITKWKFKPGEISIKEALKNG